MSRTESELPTTTSDSDHRFTQMLSLLYAGAAAMERNNECNREEGVGYRRRTDPGSVDPPRLSL